MSSPRAVSNPTTDDLILCAGTLWDLRQRTQLHTLPGHEENAVFHPHGLEIINNTEVMLCNGSFTDETFLIDLTVNARYLYLLCV